jgi:hypothetical protein
MANQQSMVFIRKSIYDFMEIPEDCQLGKRVFKKFFHENANLGATDKKAFRDDIDTVTWQYTLKASTIHIQPYEDDYREYQEIEILHVDLKTLNRTRRIAEVIHRGIPYPLVIVFAFDRMCALSTAHKRFSQAEKGAIVAEDFALTDWIDLSGPTPVQKEFLESLAVSALPHTHFFALYSALADRLVALECARLTGKYRLETIASKRRAQRNLLAACHELESMIVVHKAAIKKETQFNRQVELNTKIKELEKLLKKKASGL